METSPLICSANLPTKTKRSFNKTLKSRGPKAQYTYDVHENCLVFKTSHPNVHLLAKYFNPLERGRPILNEPLSPPSPTNYGTTTAPCM